jgi:transcriptional regulator with XRE-family HTH domain
MMGDAVTFCYGRPHMAGTRGEIAKFGPRVKQLRKDRGMSAGELAKAVGVTPASVWQWENKGRHPRGSTVEALAEALGVETGYLEGQRRLLAPSIAPGQEPRELIQDLSLEELMKAIEAKGFLVQVSSKA